jgi:hypothetical protein
MVVELMKQHGAKSSVQSKAPGAALSKGRDGAKVDKKQGSAAVESQK